MSKKNNSSKKGFFATIGGWFGRMFFGGSNKLAKDMENREKTAEEMQAEAKAVDVEEIVSPGMQIVRNFLERKLAVGALILLICMFITMFIGPLFMPNYYDAYTEVTQKSIPPTMSMMSVPREMRDDIKMIDGFGSFTVGLSKAGKVYVWGSTQLGTTGIDIGKIPEEVQNAKVAYVAAGIDHIVAIGEDGKIYAWGDNRLGQYGSWEQVKEVSMRNGVKEPDPNIAYISEDLVNNGVDVDNIEKLVCGYQCTAILMKDGSFHLWGNKRAYANIDLILAQEELEDIDFTLNYIVALNAKRESVYTGQRGLYDKVRGYVGEKAVKIKNFLGGRKIQAIAANSTSICLLLDDGNVCFAGDFAADSTQVPVLAEGEQFVQVVGGSYHYSGVTNLGNVYSWGSNTLNQTKVPNNTDGSAKLYAGAFQTYAVDANDELVAKWGLKGYLFGTDNRGADIFQRIINGGKMTMTIGAVAVIISTIIGIIIGCVAGYFGGKVDILLMRVAEIFSAIPFLPFAMILSAILGRIDLSETARIFIIMCILGVLTWPGLARLVRGQVLVARESEYVTAAKAMGVKERVIAFKHILPNVMSVILVTLMLDFGTCMLTESSLSYLGFGVAYPRPTWGNMLNGANNETIISNYWWQWLFTGMFLAITCICINIVGDALNDVMNPKTSAEK